MVNFLLLFLTVLLLFIAYRKRKEEYEQDVQARISGEVPEPDRFGASFRFRSPLELGMTYSSQAGIKFERNQMLYLLIGCTLTGIVIGLYYGTRGFGLIVFALLGLATPLLFLKWRQVKYLEAFRFALQDLTEYGISCFKVEPNVDAMLREVVKTSKNKVLVRECEEVLFESLIMNQPALRMMTARAKQSGVPEYELLVTMTEKATSTDASLVQIYEDLNKSIRRYFGTEKKILAKTSGMRNLGYLLALLPVPMFAYFWSSIAPNLNGWVKILFFIVCFIILLGAYLLTKVVKVRV